MVSSTTPVNSSAALPSHAEGEPLVLRILANRRAGQVVRLTSDKCTIGSGSHCTLRLVAREVKPLHCLILRGSARTVVRCWAPDTLLNGRAFRDAELNVGDRLAIGPIELEVLEPGGAYLDASETCASSPDSEPIQQRELRILAKRLRLANHRDRRRVQRLREAEREIARLEVLQATASRQDAAVGVDLELEADREAFEHKCQAWEVSRKRVEAEIAEVAQRFNVHRTELEAKREAVDKDRDDWEAIRSEAESRLADRASQLDRREADLDRRQSEPVSAARILDRPAAASGAPASRLPDPHEEAGDGDSLARPTEAPASQPADSSASSAMDADESVDEYMNRLLEGAPSPTQAAPLGDASAEPLEEPRADDTSDDLTIGGSAGDSAGEPEEPQADDTSDDLTIGGSEWESVEEVVDSSTEGVTDEWPELEPQPAAELSEESASEPPTVSRKSDLRDREARLLAEARNLPPPLHTAEEFGEDDNLPARLGAGWLVAVGVILAAAATGCWWTGWLNSIAFYVVMGGLWVAFAWFAHNRLSDRSGTNDQPPEAEKDSP